MRLLICTQVVDSDDSVLGFFHQWIEEFAKRCDEIYVVCLRKGAHSFPSNVHVHSLGKEGGHGRLTYLWRFYKYVWLLRKNYDSVFVHMNPEYVVLGFPFWKVSGKTIGLWYTHKSVNLKLRIATIFANHVFTASSESFRLKNKKVQVTGHGIDVESYTCKEQSETVSKLLTIGRISKSKAYEEMIAALALLRARGTELTLTIIGEPVTDDDRKYRAELEKLIEKKDLKNNVRMIGGVPHDEIYQHLASHDLFINTSKTGSLDKAVLEAMASCLPVVTSNEGLKSTLVDLEIGYAENENELQQQLSELCAMSAVQRTEFGRQLCAIARLHHSLNKVIAQISETLERLHTVSS